VPAEFGAWEASIGNLSRYWGPLLTGDNTEPRRGEWVGCFADHQEPWPSAVFQLGLEVRHITLETLPQEWLLSAETKIYYALPVSHSLIHHPQQGHPGPAVQRNQSIVGSLHRVWVTGAPRGPRKIAILLYFGKLQELKWDPNRFTWPGKDSSIPFLNPRSGYKRSE
jgi:hypothetical protein